jgi:hypothetical protein
MGSSDKVIYNLHSLVLLHTFFKQLQFFPSEAGSSGSTAPKSKVTSPVNQVLCHEDVWDSRGIAPPFLTLALHRPERSATCPCHITPRETALHTQCKEAGWAPKPSWTLWRSKEFHSSPHEPLGSIKCCEILG